MVLSLAIQVSRLPLLVFFWVPVCPNSVACSLSRFTKELLKKCNFRFFFSRCRPGRRDRELGGEEDPEQLQAVQVPKDALAGGRGPAALGVFEVEVGEPAEVDAGPGRGELVQIESKDRKNKWEKESEFISTLFVAFKHFPFAGETAYLTSLFLSCGKRNNFNRAFLPSSTRNVQ